MFVALQVNELLNCYVLNTNCKINKAVQKKVKTITRAVVCCRFHLNSVVFVDVSRGTVKFVRGSHGGAKFSYASDRIDARLADRRCLSEYYLLARNAHERN